MFFALGIWNLTSELSSSHTLTDDCKMLCKIFQALVDQALVQFKVLLTPELHQDRQQVEQRVHQLQRLLLSSLTKGLE